MCVLHNFIWCNMLMCLYSIRWHKGHGFCQVRIEVILIKIRFFFLSLGNHVKSAFDIWKVAICAAHTKQVKSITHPQLLTCYSVTSHLILRHVPIYPLPPTIIMEKSL
jgi:hypothetical protein